MIYTLAAVKQALQGHFQAGVVCCRPRRHWMGGMLAPWLYSALIFFVFCSFIDAKPALATLSTLFLSQKSSNRLTSELEEKVLVLSSGKFFQEKRVLLDQRMDFDGIEAGFLQVYLKIGTEKTNLCGFLLKENKHHHLELELLGRDYSQGGRWFLKCTWSGGFLAQSRRIQDPQWELTIHPNGWKETWISGITYVKKSQEEKLFFDLDNDGIADDEDDDDDNDGRSDPYDRDDDNDGIEDLEDNQDSDDDNDGTFNIHEIRDQLLGKFSFPVIESFEVENLIRKNDGLYGEVGDLLRACALVSQALGPTLTSVGIQIHTKDKSPLWVPLYDDGSVLDRSLALPGKQISGDFQAGDSRFCSLLPMDLGFWGYAFDSVWIVSARNHYGKSSNLWRYFTRESPGRLLPQGPSNLFSGLDRVEMNLMRNQGKIEKIGVEIQSKEEVFVRVLNKNGVNFIYPEKKELQPYSYSDIFTSRSPEMILLLITSQDGGLLYLGEQL